MTRMIDLMHKGKSKAHLGIDIGNHSVKMVEISGPTDRPEGVSFGMRRIESASGGASGAVKALAEDLKVSSKDAVISVAGPSLIVRLITMPRMNPEELSSAIRFETEKFIPFDINDCILDFSILPSGAKDRKDADIMLAAVKKEHVMEKVKTAGDAGFTVRAVDADIIALTNAFLKNFPPADPQKTTALINIGASSTDLSILRGAVPVFVREIGIGSVDFTAAVAKKTGKSAAEAEELKVMPKERLEEVIASSKPAVSTLLDEVKMSFGYHENQSGHGVDEIFVSGGGSGMAGLDEDFQEMFGSKPLRWDPFKFLGKAGAAGPQDSANGSYCVAVGLALRAV
jgi:type IV pilus assembly protein PilM